MRYLFVYSVVLLGPTYAAQQATPQVTKQEVASQPGSFQQTVQPVLKKNCTMCHNDKMASGGLSVERFSDPALDESSRGGWERIVSKLRTGEMPPKGAPQPTQEQRDALVKFVQESFDAADRLKPPDPGACSLAGLTAWSTRTRSAICSASASGQAKNFRQTTLSLDSTISARC